jgi:uncharacterized membrane protein/protein-disulfide isomerase
MYRKSAKLCILILALSGAAISAIALYEHIIYRTGLATGPSFCNISSHINCEAVNASDWSLIFGFPIASYGLFFYVAVLGLLLVSGPNRVLSDERANRIIFLGGVLGSLASTALFAISEFIIGALCLMCMGLYLISFALLAVTWWGSGATFKANLVGGARELGVFVDGLCRRDRRVFAGAICLIILATLAALSPTIAKEVALAVRGAGSIEEARVANPVKAWSMQPLVNIPVVIDQGVYGDYIKGDLSAPIQVIEFADMECPGCRMLYLALDPLLEKYKGRYSFVFKNYPLDAGCNSGITSKFHQNSCFAAEMVRCAGEQGRFWEALDYAFTAPALELQDEGKKLSADIVRESLITGLAGAIGIDTEGLKECINSSRQVGKIKSEVKEGDTLGLSSTPSIWINGRKVERPTPEALARIFEEILKNDPSNSKDAKER